MKTIINQYKKCCELTNFEIIIEGDNIFEWNIYFSPNTNVYKKTYLIKCLFTQQYPFEKPNVKFMGNVFHPNINDEGEICLDTLNNWDFRSSMVNVLNSIQLLFIDPNLNNPTNIDAVRLWGDDQYLNYI